MFIILVLALIFAVTEWFFEYKKNKLGIYLTKPFVIIFLIGWIWLHTNIKAAVTSFNQSGVIWFIFGLIFCFGGDIFLMLSERFFLPGLISFLIGHICYIAGFGNPVLAPGSDVVSWIIAIILVFVAGWVYVKLSSGMQSTGQERMRIPVLFYTVVIVLMVFTAMMTLLSDKWDILSSVLVSLGAILFLISDIMNAWVRFVTQIPNHRVWVMSTYHIAQIFIAVGVGLHFSI